MTRKNLVEIAAGAVVLAVAAVFLAYAVTHSGRAIGPGYELTARFDRIDGLGPGADVKVSGVKVGSVVSQRIDPETFLAVVTMRIDNAIRLPADTSAEIASESLLGGRYIALVPGGSDRLLPPGGRIEATQSAVSLEALLGRFIFSVTDLVSAVGREGGGGQPAPQRPGG
ncbi:MAG: outer membrane lipid asymmetry maintenance protein MlaD [Acetobacteraceae bacterium]